MSTYLDAEFRRRTRDRHLAEILSDFGFHPGASQQFIKLESGRFDVVDGADTLREKATGRAAAEVIRELLTSSEYSHFLKPAAKGGTTPSNAAADASKPQSLGDQILAHIRANAPERRLFRGTRLPQRFNGSNRTSPGAGINRLFREDD